MAFNNNTVFTSTGVQIGNKFAIKNAVGENLLNPVNLNTTQFTWGSKKFFGENNFYELSFIYGWQNIAFSTNLSSVKHPQINPGWNNSSSLVNKSYIGLELFSGKKINLKKGFSVNPMVGLGLKFFDRVDLIYINAYYNNVQDTDKVEFPLYYFGVENLRKHPFHLSVILKSELLKQLKSHHQIGLGIKYQLGLQNMFEGSYVFFEGQKDESRGDWFFRGSQLGAYLTYQYLYNANKKPRERDYVKPVFTYITRRNQFYLEASHNWIFSPHYKNIVGNINLEPWQMWTTSFGLGYTRMLNNKWGLNLTAIMNLDKLAAKINILKTDYDSSILVDYKNKAAITTVNPALKMGTTYFHPIKNKLSIIN
ncbi:MAG: hypothetical protein IPP29_24560 [Bacteroidetes bacterium]|nr:hypothetical protein [Bacteroidota bacterium]